MGIAKIESQAIRELAYQLWEADGRRDGCAEEYWLEAERRLIAASPHTHASSSSAVDESATQSFPASDPPASHIPDQPPANADAKWAAAEKAQKKSSRPSRSAH